MATRAVCEGDNRWEGARAKHVQQYPLQCPPTQVHGPIVGGLRLNCWWEATPVGSHLPLILFLLVGVSSLEETDFGA